MKIFLFVITVCVGIIFISCSKQTDDDSPFKKKCTPYLTSDQFPLQVGNYWHFRHSFREIIGDTTLDGKIYFMITFTPIIPNSELMNYYVKTDTMYYRNDGPVTYVKYTPLTPERKLFDFSLKEKESFTNILNENGNIYHEIVTLSQDSSTIVINNETIIGKLFSYDTQEWIDEECSRVANTQIGFIYEFSGWGIGDTMVSYHINPIIYFDK